MNKPDNAPRGRGAPNKRTPEIRERVLEGLRLGMSLDSASKYAGLHYDTLNEWRKADPDFSDAVEKARAVMEATMLALIQKSAVGGSWQAAAWKLERIFPEKYGRKYQPLAMVTESESSDKQPGKVYTIAIQPAECPTE
jgi:hypothetical protein